MIIGKSFTEYIFIRASIISLRLLTPLAFFLLILSLCSLLALHPLLTAWSSLEVLFYLFVYLPRRRYLQQHANHPALPTRSEREVLWNRCHGYIPDVNAFLANWFLYAPLGTIKRQNVQAWILWAFFSADSHSLHHKDPEERNQELHVYVNQLEHLLGRSLETGFTHKVDSMRHTLQPVIILHRPFLWLTIVGATDSFTHLSLAILGFNHYSTSTGFDIFPPRPFSIFSRPSSSSKLSYWYRPHRSKTKIPIVFLHGIGIGLFPYIPFFNDIIKVEQDVGILAIEILPVSMRITSPPLSRHIFCSEVRRILSQQHITNFVLVSHSYGTALSTHILHDPLLRPRLSSLLLVDPIPFLLHLPTVAYNFIYRKPTTANEWQLWYFASRDMGIAHTLARHFFWTENILWKEELEGLQSAVVLAGQDSVLDAKEVWKYLTGQTQPTEEWTGKGMTVRWFQGLDHSQVFRTKERREPMVKLLQRFVS